MDGVRARASVARHPRLADARARRPRSVPPHSHSPWARDTFVLVVTGRIEGDDVVHALDAGADDYLFKPFTPPSITARLAIAERRIAANKARWAAEEALANAQWMAGIGQTALAIQHEVNNPLAALLGNVQLMLMDETLPTEVRELGDDMLAQARRVRTW